MSDSPDFAASMREPVDLLVENLPISLPVTASVARACELMRENHVGCIVVVDARSQQLAGIFTERDVVMKVVGKSDPEKTPLSAVMTRDVESLTPEDAIGVALALMATGGYRHVPVVDGEGRVLGVVSAKDLLRRVASLLKSE